MTVANGTVVGFGFGRQSNGKHSTTCVLWLLGHGGLPGPKQLLLLLILRSVLVGLRSESYGTASIQHSDSGCPSTQLAAIFMRFESNETSTQHSELD